jgi:hypothetical protein
MTKPTLTLTAGSLTEPTHSSPSGRNGPFSAVLRTANHQYSRGKTSHVCGSRVVRTKPSTPHPIHKLDSLIARWLDEHPWIATRTRNAAKHLNRRWRDLSQEQKHKRAFEYAEAAGAYAFSLNLSEIIQKRAAAAHDPVKYLAKRLNEKLRKQKVSGLEYAFILDVSAPGKLHAHGIFILGQNDINLVKVALRNAGGRFSTREVARQLSVSNLNAGLGFHRYIRKARKSVSHVLSGKRLEFVSQTLNRATEAFHEANRPKKRRDHQSTIATSGTNSLAGTIGESPAHLNLLGLHLLGYAPKALLRPRQSLSHAIAFSGRSSGRGGQPP